MYDSVLIITAAFLFMVLVVVEILTRSRGMVGRLIAIQQPDVLIGWLSCQGKVQLKDGSEVKVEMPGCTVCMERLIIGDNVRVMLYREGYRLVGKTWQSNKTEKAHFQKNSCLKHLGLNTSGIESKGNPVC